MLNLSNNVNDGRTKEGIKKTTKYDLKKKKGIKKRVSMKEQIKETNNLVSNELIGANLIICLKFFSQHTRRDTVRKKLLGEHMMIYLERSMTMLVS